MLAHGVLRQYMPAMQSVITGCYSSREKPEQVLIRWRRVEPSWFYANRATA
jgi:hypothetical protein